MHGLIGDTRTHAVPAWRCRKGRRLRTEEIGGTYTWRIWAAILKYTPNQHCAHTPWSERLLRLNRPWTEEVTKTTGVLTGCYTKFELRHKWGRMQEINNSCVWLEHTKNGLSVRAEGTDWPQRELWCPSLRQSIHLHVYLSIYASIHTSLFPSLCVSACMCICPSVRPPVHPTN